jgi:deoxyribonuclease IV
MLVGAHVSTAGGLQTAVERGVQRKAEAIQVFNQSPRMWRPTAYGEEDFKAFCQAISQTGIRAILIHAVYLLNCASEDREIRRKSVTSLIQSLRVGDGIDAAAVILHAGSAKQSEVKRAIARAGKAIQEALSESERCELHLENTAGAGGTLGRSFEELAALLEASGGGPRLGICLDSCHLYASGYDVKREPGLTETIDRCQEIMGAGRLRSLHLNDSMSTLGSNRDRHAVLGEGELGRSGCAAFLSEPRFEHLPCVLETGRDGGAPAAEDVALAKQLRRRGLAARRRARGNPDSG